MLLRLLLPDGDGDARVEIFHDGQWGTICDDGWDNLDAQVACQQLGYTGGAGQCCAAAGQGVDPIWLDDVACTGNEAMLMDCPANGWGMHNCSHWEDASVVCEGPPPDGTTRLVGGADAGEGRVEIVHDGEWGTICDDSWDNEDAGVLCRTLGWDGGEAVAGGAFGAGEGTIWMDEVACAGAEASLDLCPFAGWGLHDCGHQQDAGVRCRNDGELRLVGGAGDWEGRVEIFHDGAWGTVSSRTGARPRWSRLLPVSLRDRSCE